MVVFPAPLGPRSAKISPRGISRSTPATAGVLEYDFISPFTSTAGAAGSTAFMSRVLRRHVEVRRAGRMSTPGHNPNRGAEHGRILRAIIGILSHVRRITPRAWASGLCQCGSGVGPKVGLIRAHAHLTGSRAERHLSVSRGGLGRFPLTASWTEPTDGPSPGNQTKVIGRLW